MNKSVIAIMAGFSILLLLIVAGCEGLAGPRGPEGSKGPDGPQFEAEVPADRFFSIAVSNSGIVDHNGVRKLYLSFDGEHQAAGDTVVCQFLDGSMAPTIDGTDGGTAEWGDKFTVVSMIKAAGTDNFIYEAQLRSAYDDEFVYFQVKWTEVENEENGLEVSVSDNPDYWQYSFPPTWEQISAGEDRLMLMFEVTPVAYFDLYGCFITCHASTEETNSHATENAGELMDLWTWGAATTAGTGFASDRYIDNLVRPEALWDHGTPNFRSNVFDVTSPRYQHADDPNQSTGYPFWDWELALWDRNADWIDGATIPGYVNSLPSGSAADVIAIGEYDNGTWTVEMKRLRFTGNGDDARF